MKNEILAINLLKNIKLNSEQTQKEQIILSEEIKTLSNLCFDLSNQIKELKKDSYNEINIVKESTNKIEKKIDKQFEKYDKVRDEQIVNNVKINTLWNITFGGLSISFIISLGLTIILKFFV